MYRPFLELLNEQPINLSVEPQPLEKEVLNSLRRCIKTLTSKHVAELMESYFIDLSYGTNFGLQLAEVLLEVDKHDDDSLGFVCTYLSYYPVCDNVCSSARKCISNGNHEDAKQLISSAILSLKQG